jgi:glyceraldehyde-3-phosphate dehydrogenase (NAD(P))
MTKASVAVNGYGTIGKRVADAISAQNDMKLIGVSKTRPNYEAKIAVDNRYDLYISVPENEKLFDESGIEISGTTDDMIKKADVIVDCTPGNIGLENLEKYKKYGVKAIYQGGEKHELTGLSFNSIANYTESLGKDYTRVVSCNTTGLARTLTPINNNWDIKKVRAVMVRRGGDPYQINKGPINGIVPNPATVPSHHGPDLKTVLNGVDITTMALLVSTTLMHQHNLMVELENDVKIDDVLDTWEERSRVLLLNAKDGLTSTAGFMEYAKELGRNRNDFYEIPIWRESVNVVNGELFYMQAVHQESDVVPENIDAIRALLELEDDREKSIAKTNKAMGIL